MAKEALDHFAHGLTCIWIHVKRDRDDDISVHVNTLFIKS
jgi:hypothetical protein